MIFLQYYKAKTFRKYSKEDLENISPLTDVSRWTVFEFRGADDLHRWGFIPQQQSVWCISMRALIINNILSRLYVHFSFLTGSIWWSKRSWQLRHQQTSFTSSTKGCRCPCFVTICEPFIHWSKCGFGLFFPPCVSLFNCLTVNLYKPVQLLLIAPLCLSFNHFIPDSTANTFEPKWWISGVKEKSCHHKKSCSLSLSSSRSSSFYSVIHMMACDIMAVQRLLQHALKAEI